VGHVFPSTLIILLNFIEVTILRRIVADSKSLKGRKGKENREERRVNSPMSHYLPLALHPSTLASGIASEHSVAQLSSGVHPQCC